MDPDIDTLLGPLIPQPPELQMPQPGVSQDSEPMFFFPRMVGIRIMA